MKLSESLAWLGGARNDILREAPGDAARYVSMGTVMVGTATVAAVSAAFAMTTAVRLPALSAVLVGLLWGALILSLDRMLIVSMSRRTGFVANLGAVLPRLALALLIGAVVSMPLVLRIFQPEINGELQAMHAENIAANQQKLDAQFADIAVKQARVEVLQPLASGAEQPQVSTDPDVVAAQKAVDTARAAFNKANQDEQCELSGKCGSGTAGDGPRFREAQQKTKAAAADLNAAQAKLEQVQAAVGKKLDTTVATTRAQAAEELKTLVPALQKRQADRAKAQQTIADTEYDNAGLLARLEALERLTSGRTMMLFAHWAIILLFVCIELLPVLAKVLSNSGKKTLYEELIERRDADVLDSDKLWSQVHTEITTMRVQARRDLEQDRLDAQREAGKHANARLVEKQQEIVDRAIDVWAAVAKRRSDDELARWYAQHVNQPPAPQPRTGNQNDPANGYPQNNHRPAAIPPGTVGP